MQKRHERVGEAELDAECRAQCLPMGLLGWYPGLCEEESQKKDALQEYHGLVSDQQAR